MNLAALQQTIADNLGISPDALTNPIADKREVRKRKLSDLQVAFEVKWDTDNSHPDDTPANRHACKRYVKSNMRRLRKEQKKQQDIDPTKCKFVVLLFLIEALLSWLIGKGLDEWWDNRNKIGSAGIAAMASESGCKEVCAAANVSEPTPDDDGDSDDI